jgi:formyl-CoA transferase
MPFQPASRALSRFTVLDLTRVRAGPTAVRQLADWGANVIKVELPEALEAAEGPGGPRHSSDFQNLHRNKRGLTLNLKSEKGKAVLNRLVRKADVLVENYRPDVKHRLGIDYESLKAINKGLVYASISGFGQDGPYRERPGFDQIAQGMGGLMSITGLPGQGPVRVGIPIADLGAGLYCSIGILVALLDFQATRWLVDGEVPRQAGNNHPTSIPTGVFEAADGCINLAVTGQAIWERFCRVADLEGLIAHPDYKNGKLRSKNRDALNAEIGKRIRQKTCAFWIDCFNENGVPCGPINSIDQVFSDPQIEHLGIAQPVESKALGKLTLVGQPVTLSATPSALRVAPPERGEQSEEILGEFGFGPEEIAELRSSGTI